MVVRSGSFSRTDPERGPDQDHPGRAPSEVEVQQRPRPNPITIIGTLVKYAAGANPFLLMVLRQGGAHHESERIAMSKSGGETHGKCAGRDVRSQVVGIRTPQAMYGLYHGVDSLSHVDRESAPRSRCLGFTQPASEGSQRQAVFKKKKKKTEKSQ